MTVRIAHLSDFHFDGSAELRAGLHALVGATLRRGPDLVVVTGDLSANGRPAELDAVAAELDRLGPIPRVVLPGNRDLVPSVGPPGESIALPVDSDLDYFLSLEPALSFGFDQVDGDDGPRGPEEAQHEEPPDDGSELAAAFAERFGALEGVHLSPGVGVVAVNSTPRVRGSALQRAGRQLHRMPPGTMRVFATHHALLPVAGRKVREGDLVARAGDLLSFLCDSEVHLALHGHVHRANAWQIADGRHSLVVASAGALVNDGRRDASFLEIVAGDGILRVVRCSVATGRTTSLFEGSLEVGIGDDADVPLKSGKGRGR